MWALRCEPPSGSCCGALCSNAREQWPMGTANTWREYNSASHSALHILKGGDDAPMRSSQQQSATRQYEPTKLISCLQNRTYFSKRERQSLPWLCLYSLHHTFGAVLRAIICAAEKTQHRPVATKSKVLRGEEQRIPSTKVIIVQASQMSYARRQNFSHGHIPRANSSSKAPATTTNAEGGTFARSTAPTTKKSSERRSTMPSRYGPNSVGVSAILAKPVDSVAHTAHDKEHESCVEMAPVG